MISIGRSPRLSRSRVVSLTNRLTAHSRSAWLKDEVGLDAVIDYKAQPIRKALEDATPNGIDVYFDNVGCEHLEAALTAARPFGRFALCGAISMYNATEPPPAMGSLTLSPKLRFQI